MSNPLSQDPRYPHGPDGYELRMLVTRADMKAAQKLLDYCNHSRKVFGHPLLEMPPPFVTGLPELCACPAERADLDAKELPGGGWSVAA